MKLLNMRSLSHLLFVLSCAVVVNISYVRALLTAVEAESNDVDLRSKTDVIEFPAVNSTLLLLRAPKFSLFSPSKTSRRRQNVLTIPPYWKKAEMARFVVRSVGKYMIMSKNSVFCLNIKGHFAFNYFDKI